MPGSAGRCGGSDGRPVTWADALDALEERLRAQEAVVLGSPIPPPDEGLPMLDGPVPPALLARALALLERSRALEERAVRELDRVRRAGPAHGAPPPGRGGGPYTAS
jgi:hypothetical protein